MKLEEKVNQSDRTISMHSASSDGRQQKQDVVPNSSFLMEAKRMLCVSPEINCITAGTSDSDRENSGFSV
tara:strand:- start:9 stop:218 length:210 start_codon:yes stop_codon:yes gene_type:complete